MSNTLIAISPPAGIRAQPPGMRGYIHPCNSTNSPGRQFREVLADPDGFRVESQEFNQLGIGRRAENQPNRRFLGACTLMFIKPAQVQFHLSDMCRLERFKFQLHGDQSLQMAVVEW